MFDWLFEGRLAVYMVLGLVSVVLGGLWWRDRRKSWLIACGASLAVLGAYFLLHQAVETRREQIERRLREMAAGVERGDAEALVNNLSPQFDWSGLNKDRFATLARTALAAAKGNKVKLSNFAFLDDKGKVRFQATAWDWRGTPAPGHVIATFGKDEDGQWRMRTMEIYYGNSTNPIRAGDLLKWAGQ